MESKLIKHKDYLLKDYLVDEMSSCSSNGFKSFPRRQCSCTTTVRFLIQIDLNNIKKQHGKLPTFNNKKPSKSAASAFQRLIAAVKRLPFAAGVSRKILKKSIFWKTTSNHNEIPRWKSIGNSSSEVNVDFTEVKREEDDDVVSADSTAGSATKSSTEAKQWSDREEKQQLSPVSVLDCPFDDDEEEVSSPFPQMEGTTKKLMQKMQRFACLAELAPLNLSQRFDSQPDSDKEESTESPLPQEEQKALYLLHQLIDTQPSSRLITTNADKLLLLDFFREKITMHSPTRLIREAERWIERKKSEAFLGWDGEAYVEEMEECGEWKCLDGEVGEMALELAGVVFDALFDELVVDISSTAIV